MKQKRTRAIAVCLAMLTCLAAPSAAARAEEEEGGGYVMMTGGVDEHYNSYPHAEDDYFVDITTGKIVSGLECISIPFQNRQCVSFISGAEVLLSGLSFKVDDPSVVAIPTGPYNGNYVFLVGQKYGQTILRVKQADGTETAVRLRVEEYVQVTDPTRRLHQFKKGDVNYDLRVDVLDVIRVNKALLGVHELYPQDTTIADADGDGTVTANDSLLILKYALEVIETYDPVE